MRLLITTSRLYRAFPELDRFDDERCNRFVAAASRTQLVRLFRWASYAITWFICVAAVSAAIVWLWGRYGPGEYLPSAERRWAPWVEAFTIVLAASTGFFASLLLRDVLLRRRIGKLIRDRARCIGCRYNLLGLPVDAAGLITCPECGTTLHADPALDELSHDGSGRPRLAGTLVWPAPWHSRWLTRSLLRRAGLISLGLATATAVTLGIFHWIARQRIDREVAKAAVLIPSSADLRNLMQQGLPIPLADGVPDPWQILDKAGVALDEAEAAVRARSADPTQSVAPDYSLLWRLPSSRRGESAAEQTMRNQARSMLEALYAGPFFSLLDQIAASPASIRPFWSPAGQPLAGALLPELTRLRTVARISAACMDSAVQGRDFAALRSNVEQLAGLARITDFSCLPVDRAVGTSIERFLLERCTDLLLESPTPQVLDAIEPAVRSRAGSPNFATAFHGERLITLNAICVVFACPDAHARRRSFDSLVPLQSNRAGRLGTLDENLAQLDTLAAYLQQSLATPLHLRRSTKAPPTDLGLCDVAQTPITGLEGWDVLRGHRDGVLTMIALERYRLAHGDYPDSLDSLVPTFLAALPIDPWSGQPLHYRRIDPTQDEQQRPYLLYSVGADGVDDGGVGPPTNDLRALRAAARSDAPRGTDFVINTHDDLILRPPGAEADDADPAH